jgi:AAHS family 4-hydroxybenzoate transporter-like MFS transporter
MAQSTAPDGVVTAGRTSSGWTTPQRRAVASCCLAILVDGLVTLLLGVTIPAVAREWAADRGSFMPVVALSILGMSLGTVAFGAAGDRFGQRRLLVFSSFLFGVATIAGATFSTDVLSFTVFRTIAAVGLGGAIPNATALVSEHAPPERRSSAIAMTMLCIPVGGVLGGAVAAWIIPAQGWRLLHIIAGGLAVLVAAGLGRAIPEHGAIATERRGGTSSGSSLAALVGSPWRRTTLLLWSILFWNLLAVYGFLNWGVTLLDASGVSLAQASLGISVFSLAGVAGALVGGWLMDRHGSFAPVAAFAMAGALLFLVLGLLGWPWRSPWSLHGGLALLGFTCCGLQPMLFALVAAIYPPAIRSSGLGAATGFGRLGAVASALVGAGALAIDMERFLMSLVVAFVLLLLSLFALRPSISGNPPK